MKALLRRRSTWLVGVPGLALLLVVGGPFVYTQMMNASAPKPLSLADLGAVPTTVAPRAAPGSGGPTTTVAAGTQPVVSAAIASRIARAAGPLTAAPVAVSPIAGSWRVGSGTQAGYSVDDTVMGQTARVVGRTGDVTGTMAIDGTTVNAVRVVVNMRTVTCHCVHDNKYRQMLETDKYPRSTFELTKPIEVGAMPPPGAVVSFPVTGNFTIHGVTRAVGFTVKATRIGERIGVNGSIPVKLSDYNIQNPNNAMGGLSNCQIDLLIAFDRV